MVKKIFSLLLRIGVSVILLFFLFKQVDIKNMWTIVRGVDKKLLALAIAVNFFNYLFCFFRWKKLLYALNLSIPKRRILISFSGGIFFNLFLPSAIGGDLVRSLDLASFTKKPRQIVATVLLDRLSGFVALSLLVAIALIIGGSMVRTKAVLVAAGLIFGLLIAALLVLFNSFVYQKINALLDSPTAGRIRESIRNLHEELHIFRNHKKVIIQNLLLSLLVQLIAPISTYCIALALGVHIKMIYLVVFLPIVGAITMLPISLGGLGLRDATTVFFFNQIGIGKDMAFTISLVGFAITILYGVLGGLLYVFTVHHRRLQPASS
ncbi:MAG: flippase-like domain-containing protein [Candidatus Omnitrophica bacterium]|nr:flippase-like domain-containing protein [Candidatus Omnitrophota bacterium]